jgi:hypothetical protein
MDGKTEIVYWNNPTAMAVVAMGGICLPLTSSRRNLDSFLEPGGIPAVVRLLTKSPCRLTRLYAAKIIESLLSSWTSVLEAQEWAEEIADLFFQAGEWRLEPRGPMCG